MCPFIFGNVYSYDILNIYKVRSSISRLGLFLIWLLNTGLAKYLVFSASTVIITSLRSLSVKMFTLIFGCHLFKAFEAVPVRQQKNLSCGVRIDLGLELAGAKFHLKNIPFYWEISFFIRKFLFFYKYVHQSANLIFVCCVEKLCCEGSIFNLEWGRKCENG